MEVTWTWFSLTWICIMIFCLCFYDGPYVPISRPPASFSRLKFLSCCTSNKQNKTLVEKWFKKIDTGHHRSTKSTSFCTPRGLHQGPGRSSRCVCCGWKPQYTRVPTCSNCQNNMSIIVNMSLCQSAISTPFIQKHRILVTDCKLRCCLFNWWMARVLPWLGPSAQENQIKLVFTVEIQLLTASDELEACNRPDSSGWNHVASHKWQVATISSKRWIHKARKGL